MSTRPTTRIAPEILAAHLIPSENDSVLDFGAIFQNDHPVEIEIGFGKAAFLVEAAQAFPDTNWVGIEVKSKLVAYGAHRLWKRGLPNARVLRGEAQAVVRDRIGPGSVAGFHVYFPDPWWKKRHARRRVFTVEFFIALSRALAEGGRIDLASDVPDVFTAMMGAVRKITGLRHLGQPAPHSRFAGFGPSNFAAKAEKEGRSIQAAAFVKEGAGSLEPSSAEP